MGAEQKGAGARPRKIKLDEVTARVVADPKAPGDAILVTGFLGESSEPEHIRIYWDASMGSYIDADTADIVHTEPIPKDQSPLGGSYIWLKRTAPGLSGDKGGHPMTGRFFEGPLMAAYGTQFGGAAPAGVAGFGGAVNVAYTNYIACHPTIFCTQVYCHSVLYPCASGLCTRTVFDCTLWCPPVLTARCPVASPGCPPVGPGTPVQGQFAAMADPAAAAQMAQMPMPSLVCSYAPHCWYSYGACPTQYGCGPFHTPNCPQFQAQAQAPMAAAGVEAGAGAAVGSYAPHCWYSWNACPTQYGCGPHHTPGCPQFQAQAQAPMAAAGIQAGAGGVVGSYAPHCWYSWNACPTQYGCGPHHTPYCPQFQAQDPMAAAAPQWAGGYHPGTAMCSFASCGHPCTR